MEFSEVKAWIESNKGTNEELKVYLQGLNSFTVEGVQKFITENKDAKSWLDSTKDQHANKHSETWKTNNFQKELDEKIKDLYPDTDPKDAALAKLQQEFNDMKKNSERKELMLKMSKIATEKKLPIEIIEMLGENEEEAIINLTKFETVFMNSAKVLAEEIIKERLGEGSYVPPKGGGGDFKGKNPWSTTTKNLTEQGKILKENPELAKSLMATAVK